MRSLVARSLASASVAIVLTVGVFPVAGQTPSLTPLPAGSQGVTLLPTVAPLAASPQNSNARLVSYVNNPADQPVRLADLPPGPERRMAELEQRFADFEARMSAQTLTSSAQSIVAPPAAVPGAGSIVGADTDMPAKWNFGFEAQIEGQGVSRQVRRPVAVRLHRLQPGLAIDHHADQCAARRSVGRHRPAERVGQLSPLASALRRHDVRERRLGRAARLCQRGQRLERARQSARLSELARTRPASRPDRRWPSCRRSPTATSRS